MLDVNLLERMGCFGVLNLGTWRWPEADGGTSLATLRGQGDGVELRYRANVGTEASQDVSQVLRLARVPCHLGGSRTYFVCPGMLDGVACARRVLRLYQVRERFLCRHCQRLGHASQAEGRWPRALRRAVKARARLGGPTMRGSPLPSRPNGMRQRTFDRLLEAARTADARADEAFFEAAERLIERFKKASEQRQANVASTPSSEPSTATSSAAASAIAP